MRKSTFLLRVIDGATWFALIAVASVARALTSFRHTRLIRLRFQPVVALLKAYRCRFFADSGYYNAYFTGGMVTLNGNNGSTQNFNIASGQTLENFSAAFSYPDSGSYVPVYSFTAYYSELYTYYQNSGYWQEYSYSCGFLCTGYGEYWVDTSHYVTNTYYYSANGSSSGALTVNAVDPVPGPTVGAGASSFALAALFLGWLVRRHGYQ